MNMELANRLASYRKKAGLSQEELADKLRVTRQAVSKWECGESSPDTDNLIALSKLYGVTLDELVNGETETKEDKKEEEPFIHIKGEDGEVKIKGVHIEAEDDEGNKVHIGKDGIKLEGSDKEEIKVKDIDDQFEERLFTKIFTTSVVPFMVVIAYILLGCLLPDGEGWRNYWVLFFLIPIIPSLMVAIQKKRFCAFAFPVLVVMVYLSIGMFANIWHPTWVMFLTIPLYYSTFGPIDAHLHHKKRGHKVVVDEDVIDNKED